MSRRKVEPYKRTSLEIASNIERPVWNDTLRGILVALVKDRRALWDFRLRSTQERSMLFFRDIATILSNQDKRMNEWAVLEKWCWMMEMFARAVERPSFEWRFKGAMAFHYESVMNGVQYLDVNSAGNLREGPECIKRLWSFITSPLHQIYIWVGMPEHFPAFDGATKPKAVTKRNRGRRSSLTFLQGVNKEGISDVSNTKDVIRDEVDSGEKALNLDTACKDITIKQEVPEGQVLTREGMEILEMNIVEPLLENSVRLTADELSKESSQLAASDVVWSTEMICVLIECVKDVPALWHHNHPDYRNSAKRKEHLVEIATKLRALPGGAIINGLVFTSAAGVQLCANTVCLTGKELAKTLDCYKKGVLELEESLKKLGRQGFTNSPSVMQKSYEALKKFSDFSNVEARCRFVRAYGHVSGKWSILRECFNKQMKKSKQGTVSNWEHYNRLLFLSPEVMSAWKFDDLSGDNQQTPVSTSAADVSVDMQKQLSKFIGLVSESVKLKDVDNNPIKKSRISLEPSESVKPKDAENNTIRKPKMSLEPNTVKVSIQKDSTPNVQQVVSTWVPPREDSLDTVLHSLSATPPSATAQVTETARELEAKRSELAFRLQKDINDVIFKYQLESLRHQ
uniref:MADF domain-containing protein n=1 Tax=Angiostrongylus cantonensis TaxID=6313 RepID=A0A158PA31_ANGCA